MTQFVSFILKEARHILRDRRTMLTLFGMPVTMMIIFGFAISTDVRNVRTVVVLSSLDSETRRATDRLAQSEYFEVVDKADTPAEAERLIRNQQADVAVVFSPAFASRHGSIQVLTDGSDPNMAQLYANYLEQTLLNDSGGERPFTLNLSLLYNPQMRSSYNFVPGIMGMLLMLICALMTSVSIVREKERGTMEVLLVSPVRPLVIIAAKVIPYLVLAFGILALILLISRFVLGVPVSGALGWILAVSGIYVVVALSLGVLISIVARTQLAALLASAMMLILPCILLSGMMFPIESMPEALQYVSAVMPPRYYVSAIRKLMVMGVGIDKVTHELAVLATMAVALMSLALWKFNDRLE